LNANLQHIETLNSTTFQGLSRTFKHLICFQAFSRDLIYLLTRKPS